MQIQAINSVDFTGRKDGSKKTHGFRTVGFLSGLGIAALDRNKIKARVDEIMGNDETLTKFDKILANMEAKLKARGADEAKIAAKRAKVMELSPKLAKAGLLLIPVLGLTLIGAIVDKIVNKNRAKKAVNV